MKAADYAPDPVGNPMHLQWVAYVGLVCAGAGGDRLGRLPRLGVLNRLPDTCRRHRHFQMPDAVVRQRVDHCIRDRRQAAGGAGFAAALGAERIALGRYRDGSATLIIGASCARGMA